jgi:hypothetical protein
MTGLSNYSILFTYCGLTQSLVGGYFSSAFKRKVFGQSHYNWKSSYSGSRVFLTILELRRKLASFI